MSSEIADPSLASEGVARVEWAEEQMPVLRAIRARFERERPLRDVVVAACLHVTAETANLVRTLTAAGAQVALCAANPLSTQDDAAAALAERYGVEVHALRGEDAESYSRHIRELAGRGPQLTLDDGADLISQLHEHRPDLAPGLVGGIEETATGAIRLRGLAADGRLGCPVVAVNEARTAELFDTRHGTGQSTLDGILRTTRVLLAGRVVVVLGYGRCGSGVALRARGAGATVIVCEVDPVRALEARMDGFDVVPALQAARRGDVFITVTGGRGVLRAEHFEVMRDGAILANAGHFDVEIDLKDLRAVAPAAREVRPLVTQHTTNDGRRLNLLAEGRLVNLAAAEGHPPSVMDISFSTQALVAEHLLSGDSGLAPGVHPVPRALDEQLARLQLASLGVEIDVLTLGQERYRRSWMA